MSRKTLFWLGVALLFVWFMRHQLPRYPTVTPPPWQGKTGDVVTYGDKTWQWVEAPEQGVSGHWEIAITGVKGYTL